MSVVGGSQRCKDCFSVTVVQITINNLKLQLLFFFVDQTCQLMNDHFLSDTNRKQPFVLNLFIYSPITHVVPFTKPPSATVTTRD